MNRTIKKNQVTSTLIPTIARRMRSDSGNCQFSSSSSLDGTLFTSHGLQAMATQRKLSSAISLIAFLKDDSCMQNQKLALQPKPNGELSYKIQNKFFSNTIETISYYQQNHSAGQIQKTQKIYYLHTPHFHPVAPHCHPYLYNLCSKQVLFLQPLSSGHELQNPTTRASILFHEKTDPNINENETTIQPKKGNPKSCKSKQISRTHLFQCNTTSLLLRVKWKSMNNN